VVERQLRLALVGLARSVRVLPEPQPPMLPRSEREAAPLRYSPRLLEVQPSRLRVRQYHRSPLQVPLLAAWAAVRLRSMADKDCLPGHRPPRSPLASVLARAERVFRHSATK
jgi:hypothetical protein